MRTAALIALAVTACGSDGSLPGDTPVPDATVDAAPDAPDTSEATCGTHAAGRGLSSRDLIIDGQRRTYLVYLPAGVAPTERVPLVFVHHGYTMSGQKMVDATAYTALADTEHIALAFPDGQGGPDSLAAPWNVGANVCPSVAGAPPNATGDDFAFMDAMKADVSEDQCLDTKHVFVTGFSMGGYFSHHAGCMRPDIRGVAPHSGGTHALEACAASRKPIIMFHGLADPVIPAGCDDPGSATPVGGMAAADAWATHNGCALTTTSVAVTNGTCKLYDNCPIGGQVELCTFNAMGHCWAGGPASAGIYACPGYADATKLEWRFFKDHAW